MVSSLDTTANEPNLAGLPQPQLMQFAKAKWVK